MTTGDIFGPQCIYTQAQNILIHTHLSMLTDGSKSESFDLVVFCTPYFCRSNFPQLLRIFMQNFTCTCVEIYGKIQNFIQLSLNLNYRQAQSANTACQTQHWLRANYTVFEKNVTTFLTIS